MTRKPTDTTLRKVEIVLLNIEQGHTVEFSCDKANLDKTTYYKAMQYDRGIMDRHYGAVDARTMVVEDALFRNATENDDKIAQIFWLKNRTKGRWRDRPEEDKMDAVIDNVEDLKKEIRGLVKDNGFHEEDETKISG